jgi:hypothetical protein
MGPAKCDSKNMWTNRCRQIQAFAEVDVVGGSVVVGGCVSPGASVSSAVVIGGVVVGATVTGSSMMHLSCAQMGQ